MRHRGDAYGGISMFLWLVCKNPTFRMNTASLIILPLMLTFLLVHLRV